MSRRTKITDIRRRKAPTLINELLSMQKPVESCEATEEELPKATTSVISQHNNYILSNYFPYTKTSTRKLDIVYKNKVYSSAEALYQALKYLHKTDEEKEWRELIRRVETPEMAKHLGLMLTKKRSERQKELTSLVNKYQDKVRSHIKESNKYDADLSFRRKIMKRVLVLKFEQHEAFREALEGTGSLKILSECPSSDRELMCEVLEEIRNEI